MLKIIFSFLLIFFSFSFECQDTDSSKIYEKKYLSIKDDSLKVKHLFSWDNLIYTTNPELDLKLNRKIIEICSNNLNLKNISKQRRLYFKKYYGNALNNIGLIYFDKSNYINALNLFTRANKIAIDNKIKVLECNTLNNIGIVYREINSPQKALSFFLESIKYNDIKSNLGPTYNNIGLCYEELNETEKAILYYIKSIKTYIIEKNKLNYANSYCNIGIVYTNKNELQKAIHYVDSSLLLYKELNYKLGICTSLSKLGTIFFLLKDYTKSLKYLKEAEVIVDTYDYFNLKVDLYNRLYLLYKMLNNKDKSLYYLEKKSISNEKHLELINKKNLIQKQIDIELNQFKNVSKIKRQKEIELSNEKSFRLQAFLLIILVILIFLSIFFFFLKKSYKELNNKKEIIEKHKILIEKKQNEILDSIAYAKRIQSAILPQEIFVKEYLVHSFIIYKPKDIVAGDFYWLEVVGDTILFAAADCTGHGVPGAMVSVICNNGLNRAVREFGLIKPNEILDKTRELVIQEFEKSDEEVKDGMDISLCALNTKTNLLLWSGANNPLWILRNKEILEFKADKQPIGKYSEAKAFTLNEIQLEKGDSIYIFTDGFQDQFGGANEKKYRVSQMRELFISIFEKSMEEQRKIIDNSFENWKGNLEQVDDVCVIGVRI